jgi:hypothetical protein
MGIQPFAAVIVMLISIIVFPSKKKKGPHGLLQ